MFLPQPYQNLTSAAYILTLVTLCEPLRFEPKQSVQTISIVCSLHQNAGKQKCTNRKLMKSLAKIETKPK